MSTFAHSIFVLVLALLLLAAEVVKATVPTRTATAEQTPSASDGVIQANYLFIQSATLAKIGLCAVYVYSDAPRDHGDTYGGLANNLKCPSGGYSSNLRAADASSYWDQGFGLGAAGPNVACDQTKTYQCNGQAGTTFYTVNSWLSDPADAEPYWIISLGAMTNIWEVEIFSYGDPGSNGYNVGLDGISLLALDDQMKVIRKVPLSGQFETVQFWKTPGLGELTDFDTQGFSWFIQHASAISAVSTQLGGDYAGKFFPLAKATGWDFGAAYANCDAKGFRPARPDNLYLHSIIFAAIQGVAPFVSLEGTRNSHGIWTWLDQRYIDSTFNNWATGSHTGFLTMSGGTGEWSGKAASSYTPHLICQTRATPTTESQTATFTATAQSPTLTLPATASLMPTPTRLGSTMTATHDATRTASQIMLPQAVGSSGSGGGSGSAAQGTGSAAQGTGSAAQGTGSAAQGTGSAAQGTGSAAQGTGSAAQGTGGGGSTAHSAASQGSTGKSSTSTGSASAALAATTTAAASPFAESNAIAGREGVAPTEASDDSSLLWVLLALLFLFILLLILFLIYWFCIREKPDEDEVKVIPPVDTDDGEEEEEEFTIGGGEEASEVPGIEITGQGGAPGEMHSPPHHHRNPIEGGMTPMSIGGGLSPQSVGALDLEEEGEAEEEEPGRPPPIVVVGGLFSGEVSPDVEGGGGMRSIHPEVDADADGECRGTVSSPQHRIQAVAPDEFADGEEEGVTEVTPITADPQAFDEVVEDQEGDALTSVVPGGGM